MKSVRSGKTTNILCAPEISTLRFLIIVIEIFIRQSVAKAETVLNVLGHTTVS